MQLKAVSYDLEPISDFVRLYAYLKFPPCVKLLQTFDCFLSVHAGCHSGPMLGRRLGIIIIMIIVTFMIVNIVVVTEMNR